MADITKHEQVVHLPKRLVLAVAQVQRLGDAVVAKQDSQIVRVVGVGLHPVAEVPDEVAADFGQAQEILIAVAVVDFAGSAERRTAPARVKKAAVERVRVFLVGQAQQAAGHVGIVGAAGAGHVGVDERNVGIMLQALVEHGNAVVAQRLSLHLAFLAGFVVAQGGVHLAAHGIEHPDAQALTGAARYFGGVQQRGFGGVAQHPLAGPDGHAVVANGRGPHAPRVK